MDVGAISRMSAGGWSWVMAAMPVVPRSQGNSNVQNLVGRHAEGEDVEPLVGRPAADQLRGHVVGRARAVARLHEPLRGRHGQAEVDQFQVRALVGQDEVSRADVAMDEARLMDGRDGLGGLADETCRAVRSGTGRGPPAPRSCCGPSRYSITRYCAPSVGQSVLVRIDDAGMLAAAWRSRLRTACGAP